MGDIRKRDWMLLMKKINVRKMEKESERASGRGRAKWCNINHIDKNL